VIDANVSQQVLGRRVLARDALLSDVVLMGLGAAVVALFSQVVIPLPFTPVPITGQTLAVLLVAGLLGSKRGAGSLLVYLVSGIVGLPVFSGGLAGFARLAGPTGGYLLGFVVAAFVVGQLSERWVDRHMERLLLVLLLGSGVIYAFGLSWLALYVGPGRSLALGLLPFLPGDIVKLSIAAAVLRYSMARRFSGHEGA